MPAKSKAQFRYMEWIAHGGKPKSGGPSKAEAQEFVKKTRSYKNLPERKGKKGK